MALLGDPVGDGEHLTADRLQVDLGAEKAGRQALDHAPLPDRGGIEARTRRQPPRPLVRVTVEQLERILAHEDAQVVLRLRKQTVRIDEPEAIVRLERVPLVHVAVHQHGTLVVMGIGATCHARGSIVDGAL